MDLGIDSEDAWSLLLIEHHEPKSTALRIKSRPRGSFEISLEGSDSLTVEQGINGELTIECAGQNFQKRIQADDYVQAYYENPTVMEEYVFVILDHAGVRLPLHRFHPDVIREARRQLQTSGPLPKRASKEETLAMLRAA